MDPIVDFCACMVRTNTLQNISHCERDVGNGIPHVFMFFNHDIDRKNGVFLIGHGFNKFMSLGTCTVYIYIYIAGKQINTN